MPRSMRGGEEIVHRLAPSRQNVRGKANRGRPRFSNSPRSQRLRPAALPQIRDPSPTEMSVDPWVHHHDQATSDRCPQTEHPDKLCLDSFWSEVETIRSSSSFSEPNPERRDSKHSEEGEQEEQWLQDAGMSTLIREDSDESDKVVLLSTLTRTQAAAVQRRLDSYTCSLRKKNKPPPRDVRDIFNPPRSQSPLTAGRDSEQEPRKSMETITKTPLSERSVSVDSQRGLPKEETFITDVAYCEQAAILLKQAKLPPTTNQHRKDDGTLPRVVCPQCRLGVTRIHDLSQQDMKKVRQLALIDMTALCDLLELDVKRHKTCKRKISESLLFGVSLATLVESDQKIKANTNIPLILQSLLSFLEKKGIDSEGILRVSGSQARIKLLQQKLESTFYSSSFSWDEVSPNDVAALLKKFIRDLPSPLLTSEHLNTFNAVRDIPDLKQRLHVLNLLILLLPEPNRNTLKALLEFLSKVVSRERRNRMNLWAVSTIMAPNLFLHKSVPSRLDGSEKGQAERAADIMRLLIRYQDLLWNIPNFLMSQVRKLNENSNRRYQFYDKRIKNLLRKIHTDSRDKPDKNSTEPCRTVKIEVGEAPCSSMEVRLNINSRAADLLVQFHRETHASDNSKGPLRRNGSVHYRDYAIYEVGGNIGEHCLDPETHLLDLYNNNPGGEWVIRLKHATSRGL
ncbi:rho GTPase-activating protein 40 isoform X2 [Clupea harengus]|uniref:Rho GTPase-activating protein 40 isoform X2 n=1 Tax=Clupea harengus TaxID=7950 RepID=A0A6P8FD40_CLUHA|nr:rho GTPase-activating protein 40 isoform X2 [Clupea harengus]